MRELLKTLTARPVLCSSDRVVVQDDPRLFQLHTDASADIVVDY